MLCSFSLQFIFFSEQLFYGNIIEHRFSHKHCNFWHVCQLMKMVSKTVMRPIIHVYKGEQPFPLKTAFCIMESLCIGLLVWVLHFLISPKALNGIVASIRILLSLTPILLFLFGASQFHIFYWSKTINWILFFELLLFIKFRVSQSQKHGDLESF